MKNAVFVLLFLAMEVSAQRYARFNPVSDSAIKANGISELRISETQISRKGKISTFKRIFHYDRNGNATFYALIEDSIKYKRLITSETMSQPRKKMNGEGMASAYGWDKYNSLYLDEYNDKHLLIAKHIFNDRGKCRTSIQYTYNDSDRISRLQYFNRRHQLSRYYLYEYASNSKMKHSALYKANGKLKRYWDYNCDDEGSMSKKMKDTVKICTSKSYLPDGTVVSTTNSFNYRGNPVKYVEYRNANDKVIKYLMYEGKNEILTYKNIVDYEGSKIVKRYTYHASDKGHPIFSSTLIYDAREQVTAQTDTTFGKKKHKIWSYTFKYGSNGLLISRQGYKNGQLSAVYSFRYLYYREEK